MKKFKKAGHQPKKDWRKRPVVRFLSWTCAALFLLGIVAMGVSLSQTHDTTTGDFGHP